jgi:hypothetical protein
MVIRDNYFIDKERVKTIDTIRIAYLLVFLLAFALTEAGRYIYRPWVYENNVNDMGLADSMGNFGGIIVQSFFGLAVLNSSMRKGLRLIVFFILGYIVYEFLQPLLPKGVFDWRDIFGTLIGGVLGMVLFLIMHRSIKTSKEIYKF